jgi:hypothetical protein
MIHATQPKLPTAHRTKWTLLIVTPRRLQMAYDCFVVSVTGLIYAIVLNITMSIVNVFGQIGGTTNFIRFLYIVQVIFLIAAILFGIILILNKKNAQHHIEDKQ